jgi:transcriptional regulator with XRE-family HTH domain
MNTRKMGKLLRNARKNLKMSQTEAGELIGRSGNYVGSCELRSNNQEFSFSEVDTLCKAYGVNLIELYEKANKTTSFSIAGKIDFTKSSTKFRIEEVESALSKFCAENDWDIELKFDPAEEDDNKCANTNTTTV